MPRQKAFVREEALQRAMDLFWSKGYEATSLQDLVEHMGIGRSSLYDTFGSKHELWTEALELYGDRMRAELVAPLRGPGSPRALLQAFFDRIVERAASGKLPCCLVLKALITTGEHCESTAAKARAYAQALEDDFTALLDRAQKQGELGTDAPPRRLARALVAMLHGLSVAAAVDRNPARLADISELALALLD